MINKITYREPSPYRLSDIKSGRVFLIRKKEVDGSDKVVTCIKVEEDKKFVYALDLESGTKVRLEPSTIIDPWETEIILKQRLL